MTEEMERPETAEQRQMIEAARTELRRKGFAAEIEIANLKAQNVTGVRELKTKAETLEVLRNAAENSYAGAKEMSRLLSELPEPASK